MFAFPKLETPRVEGSTISQFSGLDTRVGATAGSLKEQKNMSSVALPCLSTRLGRKKVYTKRRDEEIVAAYFFDKAYVMTVLNGAMTQLYCGDDFSSLERVFGANISETPSSLMHRFNRTICIFNAKDVLTGTSLISSPLAAIDKPSRTDAPDFTDVMTYAGRVVGCRKNQIRTCAYDNLYDWDHEKAMEDLTLRAYLKNFPVNSDFTACTTYKNHAIFFTEDEMFELYGENPIEFELVKIADVGCVNRNSLCECDGTLYFISREGIYSYNSASPKKISNQITMLPVPSENGFEAAIGGAGGVIYASYLTESGRKLYTYDVEHKAFAQEDGIEVIDIIGKFGKTYLVTRDNVYEAGCEYKKGDTNNDGKEFAWEVVTAPIYANTKTLKRTVNISAFVEQKHSSDVEVYISFDDGDFELVRRELFYGCKEISVSLGDRHYQKLVIKIKGKGEAKVHYIGQSYVSGGDIK